MIDQPSGRQPSSRAAEIAAQQVESIVSAAQAVADQLRREGERDAAHQLDDARAEAQRLGQDARREAEKLLADAEDAAAQVVEEARALSSGLQRLGQMLGNQGERILRDVQAAHKRMQADLRVAPGPAPPEPAPARRAEPSGAPAGEEDEALETLRRAVGGERDRGTDRRGRSSAEPGTRERSNPIDDLDVPNWVEPPS